MAFSHGSAAIFKVADSGSVMRDLSGYLKSEGLNRVFGVDDVTCQGASVTARSYAAGLADGTIPFEGLYDPTVDGYLEGIKRVVTTYEYYPVGEPVGATKPKYSGSCLLSDYQVQTGTDGQAKITGTFQLSGAVTRAVA